MRRLLLTLLCALIVVPVAAAASHATGDGVLELKSVDGTVSIGSIPLPARGALWGQLDSGTLTVYDPVQGDGQVYVSGYDSRGRSYNKNSNVWQVVYTAAPGGNGLHFRVTGGQYKLLFTSATGLDVTAVGVGVAWILGTTDPTVEPGSYAVDSGKWLSVPTDVSKKVPFGTPTSASTP